MAWFVQVVLNETMTFAAPLARWHLLAPSLCALGLLLAGQEGRLVAQAAGGVLTNAGQVRGVSAEGFSRQTVVKLRGVITFHEPESGITYVQDGTGGVAISAGVPSRLPANVQSGVMVEIEGAAAPGLFAPAIAGADGGEPRIRVLGAAALPEPLTLAAEQLSRGAHDGSWIELRGIVRSLAVKELAPAADRSPGPVFGASAGKATRISIELGTHAGRFTVIIPWQAGRPPPGHLVEARVRVRGVLGSIANRQRQWVGVLIFVPSLAEVQVERPPAPDPFGLPLQSVSDILRFSATRSEEERVRVHGQVTMVHPGFRLFLRSASGAIEVQTPQPLGDLKPGAWLDVVGYPALLQARVCLQDAVFRSVSNGSPPLPLTLSRSETLARYADCELVKITGRLFQNTLRGTDRVLMIESDGQLVEVLFAATLSSEAVRQVQRLRPGSELAITGIARVHGAADWSGGVRPLSLSLLVRGVNDVTVLHEPGWWTTGRLLALVGVLGLVVALGAVWVAMLRRRVEQQTVVLRRNVQREAVWEERSRIAQDIHDRTGGLLTHRLSCCEQERTRTCGDRSR